MLSYFKNQLDNAKARYRHLRKLYNEGLYMNAVPPRGTRYEPTELEHVANVITHAVYIIPSLLGAAWMLVHATSSLQFRVSFIYGLSLFILFTISTAFHIICYHNNSGKWRQIFHVGDRAVIYLFIAASYTPWLCLRNFQGYGTFVLYLVWSMSMFGIYYSYTFYERFKILEIILYVSIAFFPSLIVLLMEKEGGLVELMLGGIVYVCGVVFFKCDGRIPFAHAIWHLFVLAGATLHYISVCRHLLGSEQEF